MKKPYLIQRLKKPFPKTIEPVEPEKQSLLQKLATAFSFGGGLKNGGLTVEAMNLVSEIWRYDYMGSAEFEWGAIPESLQRISKNISDYKIGQIEVEFKCYNWNFKNKKDKYIQSNGLVFYFCKKEDEIEVQQWIGKFADEKKRDFFLKENVDMAGAMCMKEFYRDLAGWHDIDNDYLFFIDKEMFDKFCALFGKS